MSIVNKKAAVLQELSLEMRRMSAQGVLLSSAVAEHVGISSSDLECLDFIVMASPEAITAGQLAAATGLTTGAITGLVDRLEKAGFVRREHDQVDRRKVRVVPVETTIQRLGAYYAPLAQRTEALWAQYTEEQLRIILDFARRSVAVAAEEAARIRNLPSGRGMHDPGRRRKR
jgi:DNA-binding MarR family transcriptional regulator